jgi:hypothetical protein
MMVNIAGIPLSVAAGGILAQVVGVAMLYRLDGLGFIAVGLVCLATPLARLRVDADDGGHEQDEPSRTATQATGPALYSAGWNGLSGENKLHDDTVAPLNRDPSLGA